MKLELKQTSQETGEEEAMVFGEIDGEKRQKFEENF